MSDGTRTVQGTITETLIVEKCVEIDVPCDADQDTIEERLRDTAYENTIFGNKDTHGWEGVDTLEVEVRIND